MVGLLARLFIRDHERTDDPRVRRAYGTLCGCVGIVLNVLLFAAKYFAGVLTGSVAISADAFNNLSDAGSSVISLIGFKLSGKEDDVEHPFGHGRVEYIAGMVVAMIIILMGFNLARDSVEKILRPEAVEFGALSAGILAVSILVKLYMALYNRGIGRKIDSVTMRATALDSISDVAATSAVLVSGVLGTLFHWNVDAYTGLLVSAMILKAGYSAAKDTISPLLGNPPDPDFVRKVQEIVMSYENVRGIHDLVVHDYGAGRAMLSLHAEVPCSGDLMELHDMIDTIEQRLRSELRCEAVIHMDPIATDDNLVSETRERVLDLLKRNLSSEITVHDFRMVPGPTHTNVIFDAVIPHTVKRTDLQIKEDICRLVSRMDGSYFAVVTIDHPYV